MVTAMTSTAWPVWLSTVPAKTCTRSGQPTATASEEFLVRLRYWLVSGGMITRMAWDHYQTQRWPGRQPQGIRRFRLPARYREQARTHDFRNKCRGVDDKAK